MGHQAHDISLLIHDARYVAKRSVRVLAVSQNYAVFALELIEHRFVSHVTAFAMTDWNAKRLPFHRISGEQRFCRDDFNRYRPANVLKACVTHQRSRE